MAEPPRASGSPAIRARRRLTIVTACTGLAVAGLVATAGAAFAGPKVVILRFSPNPYAYPDTYAGQSAVQTFTLTNTGTAASGALTLTLQGPAFTLTGNTCDAISLKPGHSCTATVQFGPTSTATQSATLTASSPKSGVGTLATLVLTGTGLGRMYWVNVPAAGTVNDANVDGSNPQLIATGQHPYEVATDGSHLYWTDAGLGTITEANTDGSNPQVIVTGQDFPTGIAVSGGQIYWEGGGDGTIHSANLDGSNPQTLITGQVEPSSIAVDGSHIYWATQNANASIWESNLDGSNAHVIVPDVIDPYGLAVYGGHLFIANETAQAIDVANLDGSNPQPVVKNLNGLAAMAVAYGHVYWTNAQGPLQQVNIDGSGLTVVPGNFQPTYGLAFTPGP